MHISTIRAAAAAALVLAAALSSPALAATVGNTAVNRGVVDSASGLTYVIDQSFGATPGQLDSFSFYAGRGGDVTPLLLTRVDTAGVITFTVAGVGTTRNVGTAGTYTFDFGLTQGTNLAAANAYFGFRTVGLGTVSYGYQSNTVPGTFAKLGVTNAGAGSVFAFDANSRGSDNGDGLNYRGYSINATTSAVIAAVPEPATWGMMLMGFGGMGYALRRRQKVATRIRFA